MPSQRRILLFLLLKVCHLQMFGAQSMYPNLKNSPLSNVRNTFLSEYKPDLKPHPSSLNTKTKNPKQLSNGIYIPSRFKELNLIGRGMAFPSLEITLLTLSFLTFAVYLVNLMQVLIQGMKGNNSGN